MNVDGGTAIRLETQTHAVGIIQPPPDIRAIVDKTAQFVARNGPDFEKRILGSEKNNQKFNFLLPTDPYNAYYQSKIAAFKEEAAGGDAPLALLADDRDRNAAVGHLRDPRLERLQRDQHGPRYVAPFELRVRAHVEDDDRLAHRESSVQLVACDDLEAFDRGHRRLL